MAFETPCQINVPLNRLLSAAPFKCNSSIRACAQLEILDAGHVGVSQNRVLYPLNPLVYDGGPCKHDDHWGYNILRQTHISSMIFPYIPIIIGYC